MIGCLFISNLFDMAISSNSYSLCEYCNYNITSLCPIIQIVVESVGLEMMLQSSSLNVKFIMVVDQVDRGSRKLLEEIRLTRHARFRL